MQGMSDHGTNGSLDRHQTVKWKSMSVLLKGFFDV